MASTKARAMVRELIRVMGHQGEERRVTARPENEAGAAPVLPVWRNSKGIGLIHFWIFAPPHPCNALIFS